MKTINNIINRGNLYIQNGCKQVEINTGLHNTMYAQEPTILDHKRVNHAVASIGPSL
jgi:hypothetical protein